MPRSTSNDTEHYLGICIRLAVVPNSSVADQKQQITPVYTDCSKLGAS